jgi:hypothetical protein
MREWREGQKRRFRTLRDIFSREGFVRFCILLDTVYLSVWVVGKAPDWLWDYYANLLRFI